MRALWKDSLEDWWRLCLVESVTAQPWMISFRKPLIGFIRSLPNFDETRPIDSFFYSICRYKISDYFRVSGRKYSAFQPG